MSCLAGSVICDVISSVSGHKVVLGASPRDIVPGEA